MEKEIIKIQEQQSNLLGLLKQHQDKQAEITGLKIERVKAENEIFKDNVDSWIKTTNRRISELEDLPSITSESSENIQHNYELIYELKDQLEELKQELNALKLIQIITLKQKENKEEIK